MQTTKLVTQYACCSKRAVIVALTALPSETYTRRCADCDTTYRVTRTTIERNGIRVDKLTWIDTKSNEYKRTYGSN